MTRPTRLHQAAHPGVHQGDCIRLARPGCPESEAQLYQVINVDDRGGRCWLRRWPLPPRGSAVFEIDLHQVPGCRS